MSDSILDDGTNPFSDDIGHQNILACGLPGMGKTFLAATMPGKIAYLCVESQAVDNIKQAMIMHGRDPNDIKIFGIRNHVDPTDPRGKRLLKGPSGKPLTAMQYVRDILTALESDPRGFTSVVLDSVTALQELEKFWLQADKDRMTQKDWSDIIDNTGEVCIRFRDLRLHTMAIATTTVIQDEENRMHQRISIFGKKLPTDLPRYFNIAVTMKKGANQQGEEVHRAITSAGDQYVTKGHLALENVEVPDVRLWFDKMSAFWGEHGQSDVPKDAQVTHKSVPVNDEEAQVQERLANPEIKALFDKLEAPQAKRRATLAKYRSDEKLIQALRDRVSDQEAEEAKDAARQ